MCVASNLQMDQHNQYVHEPAQYHKKVVFMQLKVIVYRDCYYVRNYATRIIAQLSVNFITFINPSKSMGCCLCQNSVIKNSHIYY